MGNRIKQEEWRNKTFDYVDSVNSFVARGLRDGWENAGEEPKDPGRNHLVGDEIAAIREANRSGQHDSLRELWSPVHS